MIRQPAEINVFDSVLNLCQSRGARIMKCNLSNLPMVLSFQSASTAWHKYVLYSWWILPCVKWMPQDENNRRGLIENRHHVVFRIPNNSKFIQLEQLSWWLRKYPSIQTSRPPIKLPKPHFVLWGNLEGHSSWAYRGATTIHWNIRSMCQLLRTRRRIHGWLCVQPVHARFCLS